MAEPQGTPVRVLLLAREGEARLRLQAALADAGAELLLAVDPAEGDPAAIAALRPGAVLVALEPAVEDALERYDALLADPGILVMFDEADVAARRDGWDAARWVRHLAAKLNGHADVLPPGTESEEDALPFPEALQARAFDAADLDAGLPSDTTGEPATYEGIVSAEDMDWSSSGSGFDGALHADPELAELLASAAGLEADQRSVDSDPAPEPAETPDPLSLGDGLSLADDDAPIQARSQPRDAIDLDALSSRLDGLSLADPDSYGHGALRGAVLVEAGLGGPDAVRQLLGGLDDSFPRPVLVRLQLDGGRYDRLVQQMQRATPMPVALAAPGGVAEPGTAWFLPPDVTVVEDRSRLQFAAASAGDASVQLPAADSAFVFLSGASQERAEAAMDQAPQGALVLAQSPDSCYDGAAVAILVARGATALEPGDLAQALLDRWP